MRKLKLIGIALVAIIYAAHLYNFYELGQDINAAKNITVAYLDNSANVGDALTIVAGKNGKVKWTSEDIPNSLGHDIDAVTAAVKIKDKSGSTHTARFQFYINDTTGIRYLDQYQLDGKIIDTNEGLKHLVTGTI
jgi:hypothetical protein